MSKNKKLFELIQANGIEFVNLTFTDPRGACNGITLDIDNFNEDTIKFGANFDGSSVKGWKSIDKSDMTLIPDVSTAFVDPFTLHPTINIFCDVFEPRLGSNYVRDPRSTAKRADQYLKDSGIGDTAYFGPELEFFVFEDVKFTSSMNHISVSIDSEEGAYNSGRTYEGGNRGHRPAVKGGYLTIQPVDSLSDLRSEMLKIMKEIGLKPTLHHHEVASSQCEIGFEFSETILSADNVQKCKYLVHNVADTYGKTSTFMPKPIRGDNGSGMHIHQSIWKDGKNLFAGDKYSGLSDMALYYIGGLIKHSRALNAFTNPTTNSYKRLVPGFEAPVILAYSSGNRSASIRLPLVHNEKARRIEARFPDPAANPYYAFASMLMAGLDGIKNKIHPGEAADKNLYELPKHEYDALPKVCSTLREALAALDQDREFLKMGNVFTDDQIDSYIDVKYAELVEVEETPHPLEFSLYYSA
jgi:glutamine synthetase